MVMLGSGTAFSWTKKYFFAEKCPRLPLFLSAAKVAAAAKRPLFFPNYS